MKKWIAFAAVSVVFLLSTIVTPAAGGDTQLWDVYNKVLKKAKYVELTHGFNPTIAVSPGFGNAKFKPAVAGKGGESGGDCVSEKALS